MCIAAQADALDHYVWDARGAYLPCLCCMFECQNDASAQQIWLLASDLVAACAAGLRRYERHGLQDVEDKQQACLADYKSRFTRASATTELARANRPQAVSLMLCIKDLKTCRSLSLNLQTSRSQHC